MAHRSGTSPAVLAVIAAAISAGAGASLLAVASPVFVPTATTSVTFVNFPPLVLALVLISPLIICLAGMLLGKLASADLPIRRQLASMGAVGLILAAGFLLLASHLGVAPGLFGGLSGVGHSGGSGNGANSSGPFGGSGSSGNGDGTNSSGGNGSGNDSRNSTGNGTNTTGGGGNGTTNTTGGGGSANGTHNSTGKPPGGGSSATKVPSVWGLPGWAPLVAVALLGFAAAAFVVPSLVGRASRRASQRGESATPVPPPIPSREETQAALSQAAAQLDRSGDPRAVVVSLYLRLLGHVAPYAGDLGPRTAEEIRDAHLLRLGVRRGPAEQLTRLFEEARYSSHPISGDTTHRALEAIRAAEADLRRIERSR